MAIVLGPLVAICLAPLDAAGPDVGGDVLGMFWHSAMLAALTAAVGVLLGIVPGMVLARLTGGRTLLMTLMLLALLMPRYLLYYAWSLLLDPTGSLGGWLAADMSRAQLTAAITSCGTLVMWYWPLAALVIAQGWRAAGTVSDRACLDAGRVRRFTRITLPLLARPISLAFAVCFSLCLCEFGAFHLAGVKTVGTQLAVLYELTGSEGAVVRAAWPLACAGLVVGVGLWRRSGGWSSEQSAGTPQHRAGIWRCGIICLLVLISLILPVGLLVANLSSLSPIKQFLTLHSDDLIMSLATSALAAFGAILMAGGAMAAGGFGRIGAAVSAIMHISLFVAMFLPGSLVAVGLLRLLGAVGLSSSVGQHWCVVSLGQAARFAGVALVLLKLTWDWRIARLGEMAMLDGAGVWRTFWRVRFPLAWPAFVGAVLVVMMLGMTELSASMVLLPAGVASFAQRLLNQMHYARDQHVIASCLVLLGTYAILCVGLIGVFKLLRRRLVGAAAIVLCLLMLCPAGCDKPRTGDNAEVQYIFGGTGRGRAEFMYPRAISVGSDDSVFVIDKAGFVRKFTRKGKPLKMFTMPMTRAGKPVGIACGPDGYLYIADTHYHRVAVFTLDGKYVRQFGRMGRGDGEFIYPTDVVFSQDGRVFVSEYGGNDRVTVFSMEGEFMYTFGRFGEGDGELSRPSGMCIDQQRKRLYVADACNHRIAVYELGGKLIRYIGSLGRGDGQLRYPYDVDVMDDGTLVVCEYGNDRVQMFNPQGESLGTFGKSGREKGQLVSPWGVSVDEEDRVFVVDSGNNRVQVWKP